MTSVNWAELTGVAGVVITVGIMSWLVVRIAETMRDRDK